MQVVYTRNLEFPFIFVNNYEHRKWQRETKKDWKFKRLKKNFPRDIIHLWILIQEGFLPSAFCDRDNAWAHITSSAIHMTNKYVNIEMSGIGTWKFVVMFFRWKNVIEVQKSEIDGGKKKKLIEKMLMHLITILSYKCITFFGLLIARQFHVQNSFI